MAITIPSDLEVLELNQLLGYIPAGQEPLHTLMRRTNWHYANHLPALFTGAPDVAAAATIEVIVPVYPSADGLTYDSNWLIYAASAGSVDIDLQEATTYGGAYTSVSSFPHTTTSIAAGATELRTYDAALATTTRFVKFRAYNGAGNVQLQGITLAPKKLTSIAAGDKACGFIPYDDAALAANGPIHTEYFLRAQVNARSVYADRRQCVWSWCQSTTAKSTLSASGTWTSKPIGLAGFDLPWQGPTEDVTVYVKCADSGGSPGTVVVGQSGSSQEPVRLTADDTARSGTLTLEREANGGLGVIYAIAENPSGTMTPRYIVVEWTPRIGSAIPICGGVAPPPLRGYLTSLDQLTLDACLTPYVGTGVCLNTATAGGTYWHHGIQVGPGVKALQPLVTISRNNSSGSGTPVEFWTTDSGAAAADKILVESPQSGSLVYPPADHAVVVPGTEAFVASPTGTGTYRMCEISVDREARYQQVYGRYYAGWGYRSKRFFPPVELP